MADALTVESSRTSSEDVHSGYLMKNSVGAQPASCGCAAVAEAAERFQRHPQHKAAYQDMQNQSLVPSRVERRSVYDEQVVAGKQGRGRDHDGLLEPGVRRRIQGAARGGMGLRVQNESVTRQAYAVAGDVALVEAAAEDMALVPESSLARVFEELTWAASRVSMVKDSDHTLAVPSLGRTPRNSHQGAGVRL